MSQRDLKRETQRHRQSILNPNHYATLLPPLESGVHPYSYGPRGKEIIPQTIRLGLGRPAAGGQVWAPGGRSNTTETLPGIVLTCQGRHWRTTMTEPKLVVPA